MLEYQNIKIFLQKAVRNWSEDVFVIKKVKNTIPWACVISDLKGKEIVRTFYRKKLQMAKQKEFR